MDGCQLQLLESIRNMLPDVTLLGHAKISLQKENLELKVRLHELTRELAEAKADLARKASELKYANTRIRELESSLKRKISVRKPVLTFSDSSDSSDLTELQKPQPKPKPKAKAKPPESDSPPPQPKPRVKTKKLSLIPQRSPLPDILTKITATEPDKMVPLVRSILCEHHPSLSAMRKFYMTLLNSAYVKLMTLRSQSPEIKPLLSFIYLFSERVAPKVHTTFMSKISGNQDLKSFLLIYRDIWNLEEE